MVSKETARTAVGILGNVVSLILFTSPVPTFITIWKKGSVEQYSPAPYLATLINCGLWVLYGLPMVHPHSLLVITISGTGFAIELVYLSLFLIFSDKKKKINMLLIILVEFIFIGVLGLIVLTTAHTTQLRTTIVGSICMVGSVIMYAAPLSIMRLVVMTRSVEYMPFFLSLASLANSVCWTSYALIVLDPFIAAPNVVGALFTLAQLVLYLMFYKSSKRQAKVKMSLSEATLSGHSNKTDSGPTKGVASEIRGA